MTNDKVVVLTKSGVWIQHPVITARAFMDSVVVTERPEAFRAQYRSFHGHAMAGKWETACKTADEMVQLSARLGDGRGRHTAQLLGGLAHATLKEYKVADNLLGYSHSIETYHDPALWHNVLGYIAHGIVKTKLSRKVDAMVLFQNALDALDDLDKRMTKCYGREGMLCGGLCSPSRNGVKTISLPPVTFETNGALRAAIKQAFRALA